MLKFFFFGEFELLSGINIKELRFRFLMQLRLMIQIGAATGTKREVAGGNAHPTPEQSSVKTKVN
jgi:hypothetical protein